MLELNVYTAYILRHFEIYTTDKMEDIKIISHIAIRPEKPIKFFVKKRLPANK